MLSFQTLNNHADAKSERHYAKSERHYAKKKKQM